MYQKNLHLLSRYLEFPKPLSYNLPSLKEADTSYVLSPPLTLLSGLPHPEASNTET